MDEHTDPGPGVGMPEDALVRVVDLIRYFPVSREGLFGPRSYLSAVDGLNFQIRRGEALGLVGESGCGKTTTSKLLVKLLDPDSGTVHFARPEGDYFDVAHLKGRELKGFRRQVQMIFQDPYESMNPRRTVFDTLAEPLVVQGIGGYRERSERAAEMLGLVGLTPPAGFMFRYPHELSGGQRQRVAIARALVLGPSFVAADEPTSMLDVSVRAGVMNLMLDLAQRLGISYLYVTHDLAVARYMCHRISVMYLGKIVETAETEELLQNPLHPYTRALISAVPEPFIQNGVDSKPARSPRRLEPLAIKGTVTSAVDPPARCRFYDRCPQANEVCRDNDHPPLEDKGGGHHVACYRV